MTKPFESPFVLTQDRSQGTDESYLTITDAKARVVFHFEVSERVEAEWLRNRLNNFDEAMAIIHDFVDKVESGRARSRNTYNKCRALLKRIDAEMKGD